MNDKKLLAILMALAAGIDEELDNDKNEEEDEDTDSLEEL